MCLIFFKNNNITNNMNDDKINKVDIITSDALHFGLK